MLKSSPGKLSPVPRQRQVLMDRRLEELHEIDASSEVSAQGPASSQTGSKVS